MYTATIVGSALVALSSVSSVLAGTANVQNNCDFDVYLWSVSDIYNVNMNTLSAGDSSGYSEEYRTNPDGGGISIKIANQASQATITQFEYTLGGELVFYDISNINGAPFQAGGMTLAPSSGSCPTVECPAGVVCTEAYINPDDTATKGCSADTDLVLTLCPGGSGGSSSSSDTSDASAAPASSATPTTTAAAVESTTSSATPTTLSTSVSSSAAATATEAAQSWKRPVAQRDSRPSRRVRHAHGHAHERH